ncbi:fasciclin domain-containing protein [Altererythrobacter sp. MTPC7]|uniref:fasciclin domain-containing protein n=1 Tax=Altererythrobacter sp. MTPC7 TaxID=3056567 RepID=UPI0036F3214D
MKKLIRNSLAISLAAVLASGCAYNTADGMGSTSAATSTMVGGVAMLPSRTIVENASMAPNLSTLVTAVKAADLVSTLSSPGPITVFAPTNEAFDALPDGLLETALEPANKMLLTNVLTYHTVAGEVTASDLMDMIEAGNGSAQITTLSGGTLTARMVDGRVAITDASNRTAYVTQADVMQSNGVVHVTNAVFLPEM